MDRKRIVHTLDTPYSAVEWPSISQEDQDTVLELLCRLLTPLGTHRRSFITPSRGKRKRQQEKPSEPAAPVPPVPELAAFVDVGLAKVTRTLQEASVNSGSSPYSIVFVARSGQSPAFNCLFPQMVGVAAQKCQVPETAVRLVGFSNACADKLSEALGIPRVSTIALKEGAPQAKGLVDFVRQHVSLVEIKWLKEVQSAKFLETKIDAVPTKVGNTKKQKT